MSTTLTTVGSTDNVNDADDKVVRFCNSVTSLASPMFAAAADEVEFCR